jgi:hypothetical protein
VCRFSPADANAPASAAGTGRIDSGSSVGVLAAATESSRPVSSTPAIPISARPLLLEVLRPSSAGEESSNPAL